MRMENRQAGRDTTRTTTQVHCLLAANGSLPRCERCLAWGQGYSTDYEPNSRIQSEPTVEPRTSCIRPCQYVECDTTAHQDNFADCNACKTTQASVEFDVIPHSLESNIMTSVESDTIPTLVRALIHIGFESWQGVYYVPPLNMF